MPYKKNPCLNDENLIKGKGFRELYFLVLPLLFLISCSARKQQDHQVSPKTDSISPAKIIVLADLPDSLKPKVVNLEERPKPITNVFHLPKPSKIFIDSITGFPLPPYMQAKGFFTHYTTEEGLIDDYVHTIFMDRTGHLWIGTTGNGVSRYDGESFTTFTTEHGLASNTIWGIAEDKKGNIWFTTITGISCFDGRKFTTYTTEDGLPFDDVGRMAEDNEGNLWFTTIGGGVTCFDGVSFKNYGEAQGLNNNFIFSIEKDKHGTLWIGTRNGGVYTCNNPTGDNVQFVKFEGIPEWDQDVVYSLYEDSNGNIWFGTRKNGLYCYNGNRIHSYSTKDGLGAGGIYDILEDRKGTIWVATGSGLSQLIDSTFVNYTVKNGLSNNTVTKLALDAVGNIWFGSRGGGISRHNGKAITKFIEGPFDMNVSNMISDHKGNLWFATDGKGISRYNGKEVITFTTEQGLARNTTTFMAEDKSGRIWFATYYGGGVGCLDFNFEQKQNNLVKLTTYTPKQGLPYDAIMGIINDRDGYLWFATYGGGLSHFNGESFTNYTMDQGLASNDVYKVFEDSKGNIWILYILAEGITLFDGKSFSTFTEAQGLPGLGVWAMGEDKEGNLWFGSEQGLILLKEEEILEITKKRSDQEYIYTPHFEYFTTQDGLPNNTINNIQTANDGNLLISTNAGLTILKGGLKAFNTRDSIVTYGHHEGYEFRSVAFTFQDSMDILWLGTSSVKTGLVRFDLKECESAPPPPAVMIKSIQINTEKINWYDLKASAIESENSDSNTTTAFLHNDITPFSSQSNEAELDSLRIQYKDILFDSITKWYPIPINLVLPYRHNNVTIDFNAMVTSRNHLVKYQYILEGYDNDWTPPVSTSTATFGNIHEGHYTFKVKASSPDGVWSEPVTYKFSVLPPLHRTWWAYTLYAVIGLSLIYTMLRYLRQRTIKAEHERARQKQAILDERLRISRDLHDEVGATLSGISMYSHIAKEQIKTASREVVFHSLDVMQESAAEMVNKLNDIVWLLNPEKAQLHQLAEKLEIYAEKMAEIKNMQVTTTIGDRHAAFELPIEVRRNVYLIFKEAINNAVKYSQATSISLTIKSIESNLEFCLQDDGVGFDIETVKRGNGLNNMQSRAKEIGATLKLEASPGHGTRLLLNYTLLS